MNYITKKHLSRRTVLRGMGVGLSLPLLNAMLPAQVATRKTAANTATRLACVEIPHGAAGSDADGEVKHYWRPETTGADFEMSPTLKSLEPYRDYLTVVSETDLHNATALAPAEDGADHTRSAAVWLTGAHPKRTEGSDIFLATSIDQLYAQRFGQETPLPSIQLCIEDVGSLNGACGYGYSCVYANTVSWASPTSPLPHELDPRVAFERLFGDGGTPQERLARRQDDSSILDHIVGKVSALKNSLDSEDKQRLSSYLDDVREIERRIQKVEEYNRTNASGRALPEAPVGVPDTFEEHVKLMFDLQVLGFMTDTTRVSTFMMSRDVSSRVFPDSGIKIPFHSCSHHGENPAKNAEFAKLNAYHVSKAAYFIKRLKETPDGDGNLLDHSLVMYGSPMGDGNVHNHLRVPLFLAGHANGQLKGNLHVRCADGTPMANVMLTILKKLGVTDVESVGDSTGTVSI